MICQVFNIKKAESEEDKGYYVVKKIKCRNEDSRVTKIYLHLYKTTDLNKVDQDLFISEVEDVEDLFKLIKNIESKGVLNLEETILMDSFLECFDQSYINTELNIKEVYSEMVHSYIRNLVVTDRFLNLVDSVCRKVYINDKEDLKQEVIERFFETSLKTKDSNYLLKLESEGYLRNTLKKSLARSFRTKRNRQGQKEIPKSDFIDLVV